MAQYTSLETRRVLWALNSETHCGFWSIEEPLGWGILNKFYAGIAE